MPKAGELRTTDEEELTDCELHSKFSSAIEKSDRNALQATSCAKMKQMGLMLLFSGSLGIAGALSLLETTSLKKDNGSLFYDSMPRRNLLQNAVASFVVASLPIGEARASNIEQQEQVSSKEKTRGGKPYAPLSALMPMTRCKLWFDEAYDISKKLSSANDKNEQFRFLVSVNHVLEKRPELFPKETGKAARTKSTASTAQLTTSVSVVNKDQYRSNRADMSLPDRISAALNQADVERQWGMLQYQESKQEKGNEIRAAFNYYTSQLVFGDSYVLTASKEDKKRMIRNDELPTLASVIASDLDLRDLYRNQFLTDIEDAAAEASFLVKRGEAKFDTDDPSDLLTLVQSAHVSLEKWFGLISPQDVQEAMMAIDSEK